MGSIRLILSIHLPFRSTWQNIPIVAGTTLESFSTRNYLAYGSLKAYAVQSMLSHLVNISKMFTLLRAFLQVLHGLSIRI